MKDWELEKLKYPIGKFEWEPKMSKKRFEFHKKKMVEKTSVAKENVFDILLVHDVSR